MVLYVLFWPTVPDHSPAPAGFSIFGNRQLLAKADIHWVSRNDIRPNVQNTDQFVVSGGFVQQGDKYVCWTIQIGNDQDSCPVE